MNTQWFSKKHSLRLEWDYWLIAFRFNVRLHKTYKTLYSMIILFFTAIFTRKKIQSFRNIAKKIYECVQIIMIHIEL